MIIINIMGKKECDHLVQLLKAEKQDLREEIEKDKWYLSERAGHDIGWQEAEKHFINNYLNAWAEGYKKCYCHLVCENNDCVYKPKEEKENGGR